MEQTIENFRYFSSLVQGSEVADVEQTMEKFEQAFEDTDVMAASVTHGTLVV